MPWWVQVDGRRLSMAMSADNAQVRYEQDQRSIFWPQKSLFSSQVFSVL